MSYDTERYDFQKLSGQSLALIECGYMSCHSGHTGGRLVYKDYSLTFILEGKGKYCVGDRTYELNAGQGFMITPNVSNIYYADIEEPWKYIYVIFKGPDAETLVHSAGLDEDNIIFNFPLEEEVISNLKKMHAAGKNHSAKGYDALGHFLLVMSRLISDYTEKGIQNMSSEHYIRLALSYIEDHSSYDISVKDIADYVGIDRTHLYRLFVKQIGISPSQCLTETRWKRAISLMEHKQLSVNEIAISAGFYDLSHFSKAFIAEYNMSPGKYRSLNYEV